MKNNLFTSIITKALISFIALTFTISCSEERSRCLQCKVPTGIELNGAIKYESLRYCENGGLIFMGVEYPTISELQLVISAAGGRSCTEI